jgi:hypothetical protein
MNEITYTDKVALNPQPSIPDINKVKASDMNEIKSVVNGNSQTSSNNFGLETNTWSAGNTYNAGSVVVYNENTYKNLTGTNTNITPDQDSTNWEVIPLIVNEKSDSTKNAYSCNYVNSLITTQTETINVGTFTALGEKYNQTYTMTLPDGYTSFGILGYVLSGGGFTNLYLNELYVDGNTVHYSIKNGINAATSTITFTIYVGLIKGSNS